MFTFSVFINRPRQDVFDLLSNPENCRQWMPPMQSAAWSSSVGPGVGSTGRGIMKTVGQYTDLQLEVTRWDPPRCYGIKVLNMQFPFETTEYVYTLEPEDGGTRLNLDSDVEWVRLP
jgi:uncharacterized protein YndB with AHSA1/START domain